MKITKTRLKKIIREELEAMISESNLATSRWGGTLSAPAKDTWIEQDVTCPEGTAWDGAQGKCTPGDDPRVTAPDPAPPVPPVPDVSNIADRPISKASQSIGLTPQLQSPTGLDLDPEQVDTKLQPPEILTKEVPKRSKKLPKGAHVYRRQINALKKDGKIDHGTWKTLRRALYKPEYNVDTEEGKASFLKMYTPIVRQTKMTRFNVQKAREKKYRAGDAGWLQENKIKLRQIIKEELENVLAE